MAVCDSRVALDGEAVGLGGRGFMGAFDYQCRGRQIDREVFAILRFN